MKKRFMQLAAVFLAATLCVPRVWAAKTNDAGEVMLRVGLASASDYSSLDELVGANLWNNDGYGAGYRFGYYDDGLNFVELARTDESVEQVSVIKTQNTWFKGSDRNSYSNTDNGGTVVGCYHIQLPGTYEEFESAAAQAQEAGGFVAWIDGTYQVRTGSYLSKDEAEVALADVAEGTIVGTSSYGVNVIVTGTDEILFQFDGGSELALGIMPDVTGAEDVRTWFWDIKYRGGFRYERIDGGDLTVVNIVELEDYVKGVTPYEMGREWPLEALKTQATCARTYGLRNLNSHPGYHFDLCTSDHCQVYNGVGSKSTSWGPTEISDQAVEETAGQVIWYEDSLALSVYSSSHGGASEDANNIWGTNTTTQHPYLQGVFDPYESELDENNPYSPWTKSYTSNELSTRLKSYGYGGNTSIDHLELTYSEMGNVIKVKVAYANGQSNTITPRNTPGIRSVFGVSSIRFTVNGETVQAGGEDQMVDSGTYVVNGTGELTSLEGLYVITGDGTVTQANEELFIISGTGETSKLEEESEPPEDTGTNVGGGTVVVSGKTYVFEGAGWGHQVGMSQYGANAMARRGFTFDEICEFYFPGTYVGSYL